MEIETPPSNARPEKSSQTNGIWLRFTEYIRTPLQQVNQESQEFQRSHPDGWDAKSAIILLTVAVAMIVQDYVFAGSGVVELASWLRWFGLNEIGDRFEALIAAGENYELARLTFWVFGQLVGYVAIPVFVIKVLLRESVRDYGVVSSEAFTGKSLYAGMYLVMLPGLCYFSTTAAFQATYPFYILQDGESLWPRFLAWELLYALQFVGLEFFFRGFLLHGTKYRFGAMAIFVMMVPYCMIHFGKPMPETFGAIGAGIVLGFASLKTRSIWFGAAIHIAVAWSMDALALWHRWH